MDHLPVFLNVKGKRALVVGGGTLAARKADMLVRAGCDLTVVAPELNDDLDRVVQEHKIRHKKTDLKKTKILSVKSIS